MYELAKNKGIQDLIADISIKQQLDSIEFFTSGNEYVRLDDFCNKNSIKPEQSKLEYLFVIDGSKFDGNVKDNLENHVALLNMNQCVIDINKMQKYLKDSFPLPEDFNKIKEDIANHMLIPLKGFKTKEIKDERDFFRMFFYEYFSKMDNKIIDWLENKFGNFSYKETPYQTYVHLLKKKVKPTLFPNFHTCPECRKKGFTIDIASFYKNDEWKNQITCKCDDNAKTIYSTDLLQFYELLNTETSNESLTTQMMLVLEKIILVNLLRNIKLNKLEDLFEKSAFVLDGSLAIYYHASWLSSLIGEELFDLKYNNEILIFSVEKTGNFVDHFKIVDSFYSNNPLEKGMLYFLNDDYIKKYIKIYHNDNFYGEKNYFGKKLFYKNNLNKLFVINLLFESEADK
jgi:hypothetical protein